MIPEIEKATITEIKMFQEVELKKLLSYLSLHSAYYQKVFKKEKIDLKSTMTLFAFLRTKL
jgi:phenylacetate-CoA ligase